MTLDEILKKYAQFLDEKTKLPPLSEEEKQIIKDSFNRVTKKEAQGK